MNSRQHQLVPPPRRKGGVLAVLGVVGMVIGVVLLGLVWLSQRSATPGPPPSATARPPQASATTDPGDRPSAPSDPADTEKEQGPGLTPEPADPPVATGMSVSDFPQQVGQYQVSASFGEIAYTRPGDTVGVTVVDMPGAEVSMMASGLNDPVEIVNHTGVCGNIGGTVKQCFLPHPKYGLPSSPPISGSV